ncbi:MAG: NAD(+) diphosphatase [Alphaproteobacteria bacterium]
MQRRNIYASVALDRVSHLREDAAWLAARLADPGSRLLPVWQSRSFVALGEPALAALPASCCIDLQNGDEAPVLLGVIDDQAWFAVDVSHIETPDAHAALAGAGFFEDLRRVGPTLGEVDGHLLAYARGITYWHQRHRFCGSCGAPTRAAQAGHVRRCTDPACDAQHFPRTDCAMIVLVHHDDHCILARADRFPPGMKSVLAGFLEPGESLEDCVRREVYEEVKVRVDDVQYQHSQPWPFPSSLMVGFRARAVDTELRPDNVEVKEAQWYSRAELRRLGPQSDLKLPRGDSIASRLITEWLTEDG